MKPDIRTVAEKSGVSISTVSRVLNNEAIVNTETLKRVKKAIEELGYRQNKIASNLRSRKSNYIGLIIPTVTYDFFSYLAKYIENSLQENNFSLFLCNTDESFEKEKFYINSLLDSQVGGLILVSASIDETKPILEQINIPVILIDRFDSSVKFKKNIVCIQSDNFLGGRLAGENLIEKGAGRIIYLHTEKKTYPQSLREDGFMTAMNRNGISNDEYKIFSSSPDPEIVSKEIVRIYNEYKFDGLFCGNDRIAFGAINGLLKAGIKVPKQVQVVGFDDIELSRFSTPSISTIRQDNEKMGRLAAEKIIDMIKNDKEINEHILIPTEFVDRETTK